MNEYFDKRYQAEGRIWGDQASRTADYALELFRRAGVRRILVPGSGYGRNTRLFSSSGFEVTGVEISSVGYSMALTFDALSRFYNASALDMSFLPEDYDAIYCYHVLHHFRENDRKLFLEQCSSKVKDGGLMFFAVFADTEKSFGKGREVEKNTFESKPGRPVHYFSESDLKSHFPGMEVLETGIIEDAEDHGEEGPHTHQSRFISVRNNRS